MRRGPFAMPSASKLTSPAYRTAFRASGSDSVSAGAWGSSWVTAAVSRSSAASSAAAPRRLRRRRDPADCSSGDLRALLDGLHQLGTGRLRGGLGGGPLGRLELRLGEHGRLEHSDRGTRRALGRTPPRRTPRRSAPVRRNRWRPSGWTGGAHGAARRPRRTRRCPRTRRARSRRARRPRARPLRRRPRRAPRPGRSRDGWHADGSGPWAPALSASASSASAGSGATAAAGSVTAGSAAEVTLRVARRRVRPLGAALSTSASSASASAGSGATAAAGLGDRRLGGRGHTTRGTTASTRLGRGTLGLDRLGDRLLGRCRCLGGGNRGHDGLGRLHRGGSPGGRRGTAYRTAARPGGGRGLRGRLGDLGHLRGGRHGRRDGLGRRLGRHRTADPPGGTRPCAGGAAAGCRWGCRCGVRRMVDARWVRSVRACGGFSRQAPGRRAWSGIACPTGDVRGSRDARSPPSGARAPLGSSPCPVSPVPYPLSCTAWRKSSGRCAARPRWLPSSRAALRRRPARDFLTPAPSRRRSGGRMRPGACCLAVGRERVGHRTGLFIEQPLRQPGHRCGDRRRQVGHGAETGQDVVGSYGRRHVPNNQPQYRTGLVGRPISR
ncbi:hypothetical protein SVIOM342S_03717 [Streptomyces violaceorubidus]